MADYSKEGSKIKEEFRKRYEAWKAEFYDGAKIRKTPSNPQGKGITKGRAERGFRSAMLSEDALHLDYIAKRMANGSSMKSIMGGLGGRVQKLTSGDSSPYGVDPTDSMHHLSAHSGYEEAMRIQDPEVLREFLEISDAEGVYYGETDFNLKGGSVNTRSHVGHRGKPGKRFNPTIDGAGLEGSAATSAHPRGDANDPFKLEVKKYKSGREMFDAAKPIRDQHARDAAVGLASDLSRRNVIRSALENEGVVSGSNVFGPNADLKDIQKAKKFLQSRPDILTQAHEAFEPASLEVINGIMRVKIPKLPSYLKVGGILTAVGVIGDAASAAEGGIGVATKTGKEQTAAGLNLASGALGLASLAAPPLAAASVATGVVGALADNRIERDKRRERDTDIKAGRIQPKHPDPYQTTITAPKKSTLDKIKEDPLNELEYAGKQAIKGLKSLGGAILFGY